jgi:uncharacterized RDD family membrane protein YckC
VPAADVPADPADLAPAGAGPADGAAEAAADAAAGGGWGRLLASAPVVALRVLQFAVDLTIVAVLCMLPLAVTLVLPRNPDGTVGSLLLAIPLVLLALVACVVLSFWYFAWWPARRGGQTLAMRWLRLAVTAVDGRPATATQLGLRWIMLLVDGMLFGAVGLLAMLLTPRGQRLGDILADTVVVRPDPRR